MTTEHIRLVRERMLERIKQNIHESGYHLYVVAGGATPRYAYTIGLRESLGSELILGGAIVYMLDDVRRIVRSIQEQLRDGQSSGMEFVVDALGGFRLRNAHRSWTGALMLGALDYYKTSDIDALQIVPDAAHWTVDIPDMSQPWSAPEAPVWRWLYEAWPYAVPEASTVTTNLDALRGDRITEVVRWGDDDWEMFAGAGPDVLPADARVVPLGTLLAADPSLAPTMALGIGKGLWRDASDGGWNPWESSHQGT